MTKMDEAEKSYNVYLASFDAYEEARRRYTLEGGGLPQTRAMDKAEATMKEKYTKYSKQMNTKMNPAGKIDWNKQEKLWEMQDKDRLKRLHKRDDFDANAFRVRDLLTLYNTGVTHP